MLAQLRSGANGAPEPRGHADVVHRRAECEIIYCLVASDSADSVHEALTICRSANDRIVGAASKQSGGRLDRMPAARITTEMRARGVIRSTPSHSGQVRDPRQRDDRHFRDNLDASGAPFSIASVAWGTGFLVRAIEVISIRGTGYDRHRAPRITTADAGGAFAVGARGERWPFEGRTAERAIVLAAAQAPG